jgi:hypothetical protein
MNKFKTLIKNSGLKYLLWAGTQTTAGDKGMALKV